MEYVIIGVDPHKLSATLEVVDHQEKLLGSGRFTPDASGGSPRCLARPEGGC